MRCRTCQALLAEVAQGGAIGAALQAHLDECAICRVLLESEKALLSRIDHELRCALDVVPSRDLTARARERAAQVGPTRWADWRWVAIATAAAVTLALSVRLSVREPNAPRETPRVATGEISRPTSDRATPARPAAPLPPPGVQRGERRSPTRTPLRDASARDLLDVPVIVPPGQEAAVRRAMAAMRGVTVTPDPVRAGDFDWPEPQGAPSRVAVRLYPDDMDEARLPESTPRTIDSDEWRNES